MTHKKYTIELKIDVPPDSHEAMRAAIRETARQLATMAMLVCDKRPPAITAYVHHYFEGTEQIILEGEDEGSGGEQ